MTKPGDSDRPEDERADDPRGPDESTDEGADDRSDGHSDDVPTESERSAPLMAELEKAPPPPDEPSASPRSSRTPPSRPPTERARPPKRERPVMPTAREAAAERGDKVAPKSVRWGFSVIVAAVAIAVFGGVFLLLNKDQLVENTLNFEGGEPLTREQAEQSVTNGLLVFIIVNVLFGALQMLFAYKAREGVRRARMLLTIMTLMVVLFHYMLVPTLFGQLAAMVAAIGTAMLYMPASREFYPPRQTTR